jgi:hypothetical protein
MSAHASLLIPAIIAFLPIHAANARDPYFMPDPSKVVFETECYTVKMLPSGRACYGGGTRHVFQVDVKPIDACDKREQMAICYVMSARPKEKAAEGRALLARAAEAGDLWAQSVLGLIYLKGRGVEQDLELAKKWLTMAAAQNDMVARSRLRQIEALEKQSTPRESRVTPPQSPQTPSNAAKPAGTQSKITDLKGTRVGAKTVAATKQPEIEPETPTPTPTLPDVAKLAGSKWWVTISGREPTHSSSGSKTTTGFRFPGLRGIKGPGGNPGTASRSGSASPRGARPTKVVLATKTPWRAPDTTGMAGPRTGRPGGSGRPPRHPRRLRTAPRQTLPGFPARHGRSSTPTARPRHTGSMTITP